MLDKPYQLVIVDDEPEILELLKNTIDDIFPDSFTIQCFELADSAMEYIKANPVRIIVSDLKMDEVSGQEFLLNVQAMQKGIWFVFITGSASFIDASRAFMDGAHSYIRKPFTPEDIERSIQHCLTSIDSWAEIINSFRRKKTS